MISVGDMTLTNQEKKKFLQQYHWAELEERRLERELERWRARAEKVTPAYSQAPASGGDVRPGEDVLLRLGDLAVELTHQRDKLIQIRRKIGAAIDAVPDARLRELLRLRYIDGLTLERIAVQMGYSYMQVCRLHGTALDFLKM